MACIRFLVETMLNAYANRMNGSVVKMSKKGFELSDQVLLQISNASYSYDFEMIEMDDTI
ncbi:hypothetical protein T06_10604 [Trichinella sp. T6]|nr:hypothetical protein T06_10604 [Trichinella sp. T6]